MLGIAAAVLTLSGAAAAQLVPGIGDDALVLPRGVLRFSVLGTLETAGERYTSAADGSPLSTRQPLGAAFDAAALGAAELDGIGPLQERLRALTGLPGLGLSLGSTTGRVDARRLSLPVRLELGLGRRLALSVMVPYVQTRVVAGIAIASAAGEANVGLNPTRGDGAGAGDAADLNRVIVDQFRAASAELAAQIASCAADPAASPACGALNANPQAALATDAAAQALADAVRDLYGVPENVGAVLVPLAGSAAAAAIAQRIDDFRAAYQMYGVDAVDAGVPRGAAPLTGVQLQQVLADEAFGLRSAPLADVSHYGIGDVEIGAKLLLFDSFGQDVRAAAEQRGFGVRTSVGALLRLGTGRREDPANLVDIGIGDGQHDIELRTAADVRLGGRFWTSLVARYGIQLADELSLRVPSVAGQLFVPADNLTPVARDLGDYLELEIAPRVAIGDFLSLGGQYVYRQKGEDRYTSAAGVTSALDPAILGLGTETFEHRAGFGVMLSTVSAYARGAVAMPLDVSYLHTRTVAGGGQLVNRAARDQVALRIYLSAFGRR